MRMLMSLCVIAGPAFAETCPPATDHSVQVAEVMSDLRISRGEREAQLLSQELWSMWLDAPDAQAQALLDRGMAERTRYDLRNSRLTLDALVAYCPDYAEGYNQRAFTSYLAGDFTAALSDLDTAIEMVPNHIAAISGRGLTLMGLGRYDEAQDALRAALAMNPWLQERALISEPVGRDI